MSNRKPIPVVIPYFRAPEKLERCLAALQAQNEITTEVFVRDNSQDNILYTKAVNEGLRKYSYSDQYDYVLVLTQDCYLQPDCLVNLVKSMEFDTQCGIVAPVQVDGNNNPSWFGSLQAFPWGVHRLSGQMGLPVPINTYWANGACMLLRTQMIREIGLLDENMLFIASDSDYSMTARARGWHVMVAPSAIAQHSLDASSAGGDTAPNPMINQTKLKDVLYFAKKWTNGDLFRELSYKPEELTPEAIATHIDNLKSGLR
jgi:GT2 family glycosyltransferase